MLPCWARSCRARSHTAGAATVARVPCAALNQRRGVRRRWESQAALETFCSSGPDTEQRLAMLTVSVQEYDTALHADARTAEETARSASYLLERDHLTRQAGEAVVKPI